MKAPQAILATSTLVFMAIAIPSAAMAQPDDDPLQDALSHYGHEPTVERVVTLSLARAKKDPHAASSLATRARLRGLIPTLRLGIRRGQGQDRADLTTSDDVRYGTADDLSLQAWAPFDFGRLMFADEEVGILRDDRNAQGDIRELVRAIVGLYFERRRLQLEGDLQGNHTLAHAMRIAELTALLDAFTGGAFGGTIRRR